MNTRQLSTVMPTWHV